MSDEKRTKRKRSVPKKNSGKRSPVTFTGAIFVLLFFFAFSIFGLRYLEKFYSGGVKEKSVSQTSDQSAKKSPNRPLVAIVIDDLGHHKDSIEELAKIGQPLSVAVLPHRPYSLYAAQLVRSKGMDLILHLPMEPKDSSGYTGDDAGEGVLLLGYSIDRIKKELKRNILALPNIAGVSNHMGSKFMESEDPVRIVMEELKSRNLYFVDSLTTPNSQGQRLGKRVGVKTFKRDVFIDDVNRGKEYTVRQLDRLVKIARKNGISVGIGHPYPQTIEALSEHMPKIAEKVEFVKISSIDPD